MAESSTGTQKRPRSDSALDSSTVKPAAKKANLETGDQSTAPVDASKGVSEPSKPDTVKLYAWCYDDFEFEDTQTLVATAASDLEKLRGWKPKSEDDETELPDFIAIEFPHHETLKDDVEGKSRNIDELFKAFSENTYEFCLVYPDNPTKLLEITVALSRPASGPYVQVLLGEATQNQVDGFDPTSEPHSFAKQGYNYIVSTRVKDDPEIGLAAQHFVQGHQEGFGPLLETIEKEETKAKDGKSEP